MNNQDCKIRVGAININSNESSFYPDNSFVNKCGGSCNDINNPYAKLCVPGVFKKMNIQVFNKCRLDPSVRNNKQRWNNDKCR